MASDRKTPIDEMKEKVDILSTSIEVINQKLASQLNPIAKTDPVLIKQISMLDNKIGFLYNTIKKMEAGGISTAQEGEKTDEKAASPAIMGLQNKIEGMEVKVEGSSRLVSELLNLQKQQIKILTEQNQAINQHITDINDRITDLVEANKQVMKTLAKSIESDVQLAKTETKKVKEKINKK